MNRLTRSALLLTALLLVACGEDAVVPAENCVPYCDLTRRVDVLNNLEHAYNNRNVSRFEEILDANFTFFFSPGDVGGNIPEFWNGTDEISVTGRLFDENLNDPNFPTCRSIRMDVKFESGVTWDEVQPSPGVVWYTTTVFYEFTFMIEPDLRFIALPGTKAQFTVRNAGTSNSPKWRLVQWHDLGANSLAARASTEAMTWGGIKALYR